MSKPKVKTVTLDESDFKPKTRLGWTGLVSREEMRGIIITGPTPEWPKVQKTPSK